MSDHPSHNPVPQEVHPDQATVPVPGEDPNPLGMDCEFCGEPAEVREELRRTAGIPTGQFVYACRAHQERALKVARARLKGGKA